MDALVHPSCMCYDKIHTVFEFEFVVESEDADLWTLLHHLPGCRVIYRSPFQKRIFGRWFTVTVVYGDNLWATHKFVRKFHLKNQFCFNMRRVIVNPMSK